MLTVTLVATLAAAALWRQWRGVEVEAAERARVQSAWILNGALDWGRLILGGDLRESNVDHLGEPWAMPLAEARLSTFLAAGEASTEVDRDAFLSGQITDLQSRLNLMNLVVGDTDSRTRALLRFQRLFELLRLPNGELATLRDNLSRAQAAQRGEDGSANADAPLLPRRLDQLAWLGVAPATLATLRPYVTLLPPINNVITPINLNTASAPVILAAVPELDEAGAQRLVAQRERSYFRNSSDALATVGAPGADGSWTTVLSNFFEIRARLRLDDIALEELAVVQRQQTPQRREVHVLWRERVALSVPPGGAAPQAR